jgi:hypothetical protein
MKPTPAAAPALLLAVAVSVSSAATLEVTDVKDLGGDMYGHTLTALGQDGMQRSFYVDLTVECLEPGVDQIHDQLAILDPGILEVSLEEYAYAYHGLGTPPYDMWRDTWFHDEFAYSVSHALIEDCRAELQAGTPPDYWNADVAYICLTGRARVHGFLSRQGDMYPFDFIIPEPGAGLLLAGGLVWVLRRRRKT